MAARTAPVLWPRAMFPARALPVRPARRLALSAFAAVLLALAGFGGFLATLQLTGNVHAVVEGRFYRAATLSAGALEEVIRRDGIRTVINLRGAKTDEPWYQAEAEIARRMNVRLVDIGWSADVDVTDAQVAAFYEAVRASPGPMLVHCRSGADRTGLASALYLAKFAGADPAIAAEQLSVRYGHIGIPVLSRTYAMDRSFERLRPSFGAPTG